MSLKPVKINTNEYINLLISQSSYSVVGHDPMTYMKLQHFIEAGVDFSTMENNKKLPI